MVWVTMGHTHHTYEEFDESLTRPLYGYVTELKEGTVPEWTMQPRLSKSGLQFLFDLPLDDHGRELSRSELPEGVTKQSGGRGPTRYAVDRETYLDQHRERVRNAEDDRERRRYSAVQYELNMRGSGVIVSHATGDGPAVPDDIQERLDAVRDTARWDRKVDGYHVNFSKWELVYDLGPRGGIQDVRIEADLNH